MIAIYSNRETKTRASVASVHYLPFDETYGLKMTEAEMNAKSIFLVDSVPEPEINGKAPVMYFNEETNEVFYEYEDIPMSDDQMRDSIIGDLAFQVAQLSLELALLKGGA